MRTLNAIAVLLSLFLLTGDKSPRLQAGPGPGKSDPRNPTRGPALPVEEPNLKECPAPKRDPAPFAAFIDEQIDRLLRKKSVPASEPADDAEFLRRVTLDLTGRVPSYGRTVAFLASTDPHKRRKLIENLLNSPGYGEHFATVWRNLIVERENEGRGRGADQFTPWLAEQFDANRGWNEIVTAMLTAEGPIVKTPAAMFTSFTNGENQQPQPARLADATGRLFWGIQLRCAECHDHPFAEWKQNDFWATAAFFSRVKSGGGRGEGPTLTESSSSNEPMRLPKGVKEVPAGAIVIPATVGKNPGKVVKARFLGGVEPKLAKDGPYRPQFAAWATAGENPYFARAAVNRWWAHFFGRGLVEPLDGFAEDNAASHPELLDKLAGEFAASGFDLKHLCRVVVSSKAYQRTSRPVAGNEDDKRGFSHMAVKPLSPEAVYDSVMVVTGAGAAGIKADGRTTFAKGFQPLPESGAPDGYPQGIPQILRLLNQPINRGGAPVPNLSTLSGKSRPQAVETLYLMVLSRRPTEDETRLLTSYLERQRNAGEGYAGILWILLNSGEFAVNH